ncbi:N-acetylglucosaminyl phosphatidylinositol deacetylase [Candidatus Magnetomorum sp. HK-1]|nr:N-acetylglucosaminyl phosphatidylinositol deacetylase [Candidatus Magnetomorum sp. HK-1]
MNVLGVGAHYDDIELGCSGTLIKHVQKGDNVIMLVITDSGYSNPKGEIIRDVDIASAESKKAAKLIGAKLMCLNYKTFMVPFDDDLGKIILDIIEDSKIDIIYSHWVGDIHRDHQYAGRTTLMAGRHVPCFLMYRSNFYDTEQQFKGNFYSDISNVMEKKIEVIKSHKSELDRVRHKWLSFFTKQHENDGQKIGVKYAECFEVVRYII